MFKLVRLFYLTSAISALVIIAVILYFRQSEITRFIDYAERHNVEMAQLYVNSVGPYYSANLKSTAATQLKVELKKWLQAAVSSNVLRVVVANQPVIKVKVYNLEGLTIYSSYLTEIGENKSNNDGFFSAARMGVPSSKFNFRGTTGISENEIQDRDIVESYIPLRTSSGEMMGVFELYTDVTPLLEATKPNINQAYGLLLVFGLLYAALISTVRRADRKIKDQYKNIKEKNDTLQHEIHERTQTEIALQKAHDELDRKVEERTRDLTNEIAEHKRTGAEVRKHRTQLVKLGAVNIMGELANSLAHELNQPLTVISGCAQRCLIAMRTQHGLGNKYKDVVEQMAEQSNRASEIIRRVRSFIKKGDQDMEPIDINETIRALSGLLLSDATDHDTIITYEMGDNLPQIIANPFQLQQVILNLIHNGIESMHAGKVTNPSLTISTRFLEPEGIEVRVHNTGKNKITDNSVIKTLN